MIRTIFPPYDCPVSAGNITSNWFKVIDNINNKLKEKYPHCLTRTVTALPSIKAPPINYPPFFKLTAPSGELWWGLRKQLLSSNADVSLVGVTVSECDGPGTSVGFQGPIAEGVAAALQNLPKVEGLETVVSSQQLMLDAIKGGISETMDLSTLTMPIALGILAAMVNNIRLVLCTLVNLGAAMLAAILVMYPISGDIIQCSTVAPSLMVATALAVSIDYSLFLLSRFQKEFLAGRLE